MRDSKPPSAELLAELEILRVRVKELERAEEERKATEARLRLLSSAVEQSSEGLAMSDLEGNLLFVNRAFAAMHGYTPEELAGKHLSVFHACEQMPAVNETIRELRDTGVFAGEVWHTHRDGTAFIALMQNSLIRDENGNPAGIMGTLRDVTRQKEAEQALAKERNLLRAVVDNLPDLVFAKDTESRFVFANSACYGHVGLEPQDALLGKTDFDLLPRDIAEEHFAEEQEVMGSGQPMINRELRREGPIEGLRFGLSTKVPWRDAEGNIIGVVGINRDVTGRRRADEALAKERNLLRAVVDNLPDLVFAKDTESRFVFANSACIRVHGTQTEEEFLGKTDFDFHARDIAEEHLAEEQKILGSGQPMINRELRRADPLGGFNFALSTKVPWRDAEGNIIGLVGINRDITERKRADEALARERNLLRTVVDNLPDDVFAKDMEGRFVFANSACFRLHGGETEDHLIGKTDFDVNPREAAEGYFAEEQEIIRSGRPMINREVYSDTESCPSRWVLSTKVPWRDAEGNIVGLVGINRDITERKQVDEALARERNLLRTVVDNLPDQVFAKDTESRFVFVNSSCFLRHDAEKEEEMLGKTDFDINPPEAAKRLFAEEQEIIRSGRPMVNSESYAVRGPGKPRWLLSTKVPWRDAGGNIVGLVGINRDITERKLAAEALAKERNLLRTLVDNLPDLVFAKDTESRFVFANPASIRIHEAQTEEELLGKTDFDLGKDPEPGAHFAEEQAIIRSGRPMINTEICVSHLPGPAMWLLSTKVPWRDADGRIVGLVGINRDITERKLAEEALAKERNLLRALVDNLPDCVFAKDTESRFVFLNRASVRDLDADTEEELLGKTDFDLPQHPAPEKDFAMEQEIIRSGQAVFDFEICVRHRSGPPRWLLSTKVPWRDADGKIVGLVGINRDITERRRGEEARRESEERFRQVAASAEEWVWEVDPAGLYTYTSPVVEKILGYKPEEIVGKKHFYELFHPEDREELKKAAFDVFDRRQALHEFINRNTHKNGQDVWLSTSGVPMLDQKGDLLGYRGLDADVTERRRAEQALRESEELYRSLIETSPDGIVFIDMDGNVLMANQRLAELHGFESMEDTLGRNAFDFVSAEHGQRARDDLRRTLELGQLRNIEYTLRKRDGSSFSGEVSASIVSDTQARAKGLIMVVRDVTERNRLQQQLLQSQKLESIGTLAGGIAHDFNNLLAVIMGNVSILQRRRALPAKTRESLADIMDAAERGSALTHQLLAYARGGLQKPAPTDLNRLIKSVLQMLRRTTPPQIEFVRNLSDELTPIIADAMQIEQVVMNLCLNAIQASQPPSTIEVVTADDVLDAERAAALELAPGAYVRLEVRDQGCGMDAETVDRMFEPFFTTKMTGRGMGLSATLGIVQSHYGQIRVASTPGGGTTMSVWLPTAVPQEGLLISPPEAPKRMTPPRGSETILVIDDDAAVTRTVDQILSSLGYCVVPHTDTDEAMGFLDTNAEDLDLVLINLHMPKCTGQGMLERIAKRWPELPALLASGFDDRELIDALLKRGAVGFVHKPFSVMTLATAVRKALDEKVGSGPRSVS